MEKRKANLELIRIVSMGMIVVLHYLSKGELLVEDLSNGSGIDYFYWLLEACSIVAVNLFIILSGYLLIDKEFRFSRILELWLQILWYSLLIPIVLLLIGTISLEELNIYKMLPYVFPIMTEHYWFLSTYMMLLLCMPFLNSGMKQLPKKQVQIILIVLLLIFSVSKSIIPFSLVMDGYGYGFEWMMCVYLVGAYIKLYGISYFSSKRKSLYTYVFGIYFIMVLFLCYTNYHMEIQVIYAWRKSVFHYNHILNLVASISLFMYFLHCKIEKRWLKEGIRRIAPYVLGVYLLHEHIEIRYEWHKWLGVCKEYSFLVRVWNLILCIVVLFIMGVTLEYIRIQVFRVGKSLYKGKGAR